jgi:hypothetical protein
MLLTTIPTDLIHDIFLMLDHRKALAAFVSTNRLLREVFKAHPNAILGQVVCNEIGMDIQVLPYAWATVDSVHVTNRSELKGKKIQPQDPLIISLVPRTFMFLKQDHRMARNLAKHYSIR